MAASRAELLRDLRGIYGQIDSAIRDFRGQSNLSCPTGCGRCCDHADTEVLPAEAALVAEHILRHCPDIQERLGMRLMQPERVECVFYDSTLPDHCQVYDARPLICRSYGDSAFRDKSGSVFFEVCPYMIGAARLAAGGGMVKVRFAPQPPVLKELEDQIVELHDAGRARRRPLGRAVLEAFGQAAMPRSERSR